MNLNYRFITGHPCLYLHHRNDGSKYLHIVSFIHHPDKYIGVKLNYEEFRFIWKNGIKALMLQETPIQYQDLAIQKYSRGSVWIYRENSSEICILNADFIMELYPLAEGLLYLLSDSVSINILIDLFLLGCHYSEDEIIHGKIKEIHPVKFSKSKIYASYLHELGLINVKDLKQRKVYKKPIKAFHDLNPKVFRSLFKLQYK